MTRALVAGVGNVFLGDDAFGVEVAGELVRRGLPTGAAATDYGIRGVHLALDLLDPGRPLDLLVVVDAVARGGEPGTLYLIEPDLSDSALGEAAGDPHGMDPWSVLLTVRSMGGVLPRTRIVACEPADLGEGMGLSEPVRQAIMPAVRMIRRLLDHESRRQEGHANQHES